MNKKMIVVVAIAVILAFGAGFWVWKNYQDVAQQEAQNQEQQKNEQKKDEQEVMDTSDWKTYRNEEFGIEFKYPENLLYIKEIVDSADILDISIIQNGRQGNDVNKPGAMRISVNNFADMKYGVAKKDGLCEDVEVLGQRGEVCDEKISDKGNARKAYSTFIQKGICFQNVGFGFFEPQYSNKDAFGMNTIYISCDQNNPKITKVFQKIYQSIRFTNR